MEEIKNEKFSMKYYNFFTKVYLTIVVISNLIMTYGNLQYAKNGNNETIIIIVINIILYIILPIGLKDELVLKSKSRILFCDYIFTFRLYLQNNFIYCKCLCERL